MSKFIHATLQEIAANRLDAEPLDDGGYRTAIAFRRVADFVTQPVECSY